MTKLESFRVNGQDDIKKGTLLDLSDVRVGVVALLVSKKRSQYSARRLSCNFPSLLTILEFRSSMTTSSFLRLYNFSATE